jgi:hypothetical protein
MKTPQQQKDTLNLYSIGLIGSIVMLIIAIFI